MRKQKKNKKVIVAIVSAWLFNGQKYGVAGQKIGKNFRPKPELSKRGMRKKWVSLMIHFDAHLFMEINRALSGPLATAFFSFITYLGDGFVLALTVLPIFYFLDRERFRKHVLTMVLCAAFSGLIVTATKIVVDRQRPPEYFAKAEVDIHVPGVVPVDKSFPSGHTQIAFAIAVYLSCLYRALAPLFLMIAGLVGLSRIALGVHFPLDVVVGAVIGSVFSVVGFKWATRKQKRAQIVTGD